MFQVLISHIYRERDQVECFQDGSEECLEVAYPARFQVNCLGWLLVIKVLVFSI